MNSGRKSHGRRKWDRIMPVLVPMSLVMMLIAIVLSVASLTQSERVDKNARELEKTVKALANATDVQKAVAIGSRNAVRLACRTNNDLRGELRGIIREQRPALKQYLKTGRITRAEYGKLLADNSKTLKRLADTPCEEAASVIPLPTAAAAKRKEGT
jgi:type II secretory pathway pseudopilin PulG